LRIKEVFAARFLANSISHTKLDKKKKIVFSVFASDFYSTEYPSLVQ